MRRESRRRAHGRTIGSVAMLGVVAALAVLPFATGAGAASSTTTTTQGSSGIGIVTGITTTTIWTGIPPQKGDYTRVNSGMPLSSIHLFNRAGQLVSYGNRSVLYVAPQLLQTKYTPAVLAAMGASLYQNDCAACHGVTADGVPPPGTPGGGFPTLHGVGPATVDFWIESGRMPATSTHLTQPIRRAARLTHLQALSIATWLNDNWPATPYIPLIVNLKGADLSDGAALFSADCAACHTISGDGDALANDTFAPSMRDVPAVQVAEAIRTGPANMPVFTGNMTDAQLRDVVGYVTQKIQHPQNPGGIGLGGLGPVAEGFIGLALGVGLLALVGFWIGDRG